MEKADLNVPALAAAIMTNENSCYDLLEHPEEIYMVLSLRQVIKLAETLGTGEKRVSPMLHGFRFSTEIVKRTEKEVFSTTDAR